MNITGKIIGYDPGGNGSHGLAIANYLNNDILDISIETHATAQTVLSRIEEESDVIAIGIDTLTCWSTGPSGWRPADRWLKGHYPHITNSIASPNSLFGSMGINGMSVLLQLRQELPDLLVSETHPKVLFYELTGDKYDYKNNHSAMDNYLSACLGKLIATHNDHEWDAVISIYAIFCGISGLWSTDLHKLDIGQHERITTPCGETQYWWPSN